mgnify:CR=1 FL=1|tara:strand:- start:1260 stop:1550 length:291 start_codon:yes stop_codon:yes gene_type:complete
MKPGTKLKSAVCDTEVMVIRGAHVTIECGGAPMAEDKPDEGAVINEEFAAGSQIGKRYVDASGELEVLCVKAGQGTLAIAGVPMAFKEAKPLPASD